jgi:hypothetical protein
MELRKSDGTKKCISFIWRKQERENTNEKLKKGNNE